MTIRYGSAEVTLPSDREIHITRLFDAPAELVFDVWTSPDAAAGWWSDETAPVVACEIDLRVGGSWRYVVRKADGTDGHLNAPMEPGMQLALNRVDDLLAERLAALETGAPV